MPWGMTVMVNYDCNYLLTKTCCPLKLKGLVVTFNICSVTVLLLTSWSYFSYFLCLLVFRNDSMFDLVVKKTHSCQ